MILPEVCQVFTGLGQNSSFGLGVFPSLKQNTYHAKAEFILKVSSGKHLNLLAESKSVTVET